jgi:anti-anti-sigma regulatory factor
MPRGACPALTEIRRRGGSFALAGPQPDVLRILAFTGLLTWFEVHGTIEEAAGIVALPYTQQSG